MESRRTDLALEAQEALLDAGVDCSLTTGEEEDRREEDTHVAATAEKLNLKARYDVAVIDECQMIADRERGFAWTRAILGVLAPEVHLCAAPEARDLLIRIIESTGDTWEEIRHLRKTPLVCMRREIDFDDVKPGDALITFSKLGVLSVAEDLRAHGKEPAIIYGALPYSTRRRQMEGFLEGRMQYVVSTDAIGMGLNLPIRRVIFMDTEKFDGVERRELKPEEIQQIAGRAGRFGMYDKGYVGATQGLSFIRAGLNTVVPPLQQAVVGFSDLVLMVDFDLLEVLNAVRQHLLAVILATVILAAAGFGVSKFLITPQYEASALMIVNTRQDITSNVTSDQINSATKLVSTYSIIIKSDTVLQQVIDNLGLSLTYQQLASRVTVSAVDDTQVMKVTVKSDNPEWARQVCEQITVISPDVILESVEAGSVKVISNAAINPAPVSPNVGRNTMLGGVLGLVISVGIILLTVLLDNKIHTEDDVAKYLDLAVVGVIPEYQGGKKK